MRLLYVEDEPALLQVTAKRLKAEGYGVDACMDGEEALDFIEMTDYDAIILDIMLPGRDGLSILRQMRAQGNHTPVLLLTARDTIADRVAGLDTGADDYLVKPFSFEELSARIRVLLRRTAQDTASSLLTAADLTMDLNTRRVTRGGQEIPLSQKEYAVLEYLLRNQGAVLTRDQIEQHVWSYDFEGGSNVVDVYIRYVRKKIDAGHEPKLIHTVRGMGYVLRAE
ncbi:MAG TPA: response regulator transcription factor [Candidatus Fimivicinus intestinavium]|nr:response regulator transcription factor [Candidatus Fimivicinus intestinavium]